MPVGGIVCGDIWHQRAIPSVDNFGPDATPSNKPAPLALDESIITDRSTSVHHMNFNVSVENAVDLHAHSDPSLFDRRLDGFEFAQLAADAGMDAIAIKHHYLPSTYGIPYIDRLLEQNNLQIEVIGSVALNYCNGGFNPFMIQTAIEMGAQIVWFPTIDARHHGRLSGSIGRHSSLTGGGQMLEEYEDKEGLYALDENGDLKESVKLCLRKIVDNDVMFSTGHTSYEEAFKMVSYAAELGHDKMFVDHPNGFVPDFSMEEQLALVEQGAYMNHIFTMIAPKGHEISNEELYRSVVDVGVENCIISSDMGQIGNPHSPDALVMMGELLLEEGLTNEEFRTLVEHNPKKLLGW